MRALIEKEVADGTKQFARTSRPSLVRSSMMSGIVPRLRQFREEGGKVSELKAEIQSLSEAFAPQIESYVAETRLPEFQSTLSQRVGEILKSLGTDFIVLKEPQAVLGGMKIATGGNTDMGHLSTIYQCDRPVGRNLDRACRRHRQRWARQVPGSSDRGDVLHTTGPVGFLIGLIAGAVVAAGAWWRVRRRSRRRLKTFDLPGGRCSDRALGVAFSAPGRRWPKAMSKSSVRAEVDERLRHYSRE